MTEAQRKAIRAIGRNAEALLSTCATLFETYDDDETTLELLEEATDYMTELAAQREGLSLITKVYS